MVSAYYLSLQFVGRLRHMHYANMIDPPNHGKPSISFAFLHGICATSIFPFVGRMWHMHYKIVIEASLPVEVDSSLIILPA